MDFIISALVLGLVCLIYLLAENKKKLANIEKQLDVVIAQYKPPAPKKSPPVILVDHEKNTHLTTDNERKLYFALEKAVAKKYVVHSQIPLIVLVKPPYQYRSKSWAKRVDFVITDKATKTIAVIELDDSSHNRKDRVERDNYVNYALKGHHPLIRMQTENFYEPEKIAALLEAEAGISNQFVKKGKV